MFIYKQPVYNQLGLDLKNVLGLKHVTISNFANKIFSYENIATTLHNHILYTVNVNRYIVQNAIFISMLLLGIEHFTTGLCACLEVCRNLAIVKQL